MTPEILAIYMFPILFALFLLGYQISFSLMATGIIAGFIGIYNGWMSYNSFMSIPDNLWGRVMSNDTLLAIPFFTFMGLILERSSMAEDLLEAITKLFGKIRGGLAYAIIFVGAILAATTGIVAASVMTMGLIALPVMLRHGYDRKVACGSIAASGTLAQIVPPSLVLIILADQLGKSVGDMYEAAFIPSFLLILLYCLYIFYLTKLYPKTLPTSHDCFKDCKHQEVVLHFIPILVFFGLGLAVILLPQKQILILQSKLISISFIVLTFTIYISFLAKKSLLIFRHILFLTKAIVPPIFLIFLVLGTIFLGIATPTEAGASGAVGAILLSLFRNKFNLSLCKEAIEKTISLSCFVMFILIGARIFTLIFYNLNGHHLIENLFLNLPGGATGFLIIVNIMIFLLAFFLDFFELVFILVPLLAPIASKLGIDIIWFGIILGLNLQTSFMHPPFGFSLFFLRSVAPQKDYVDTITHKKITAIKTTDIYKGTIPFLIIQIFVLIVVIAFPSLTKISSVESGNMDLIYKKLPRLPEIKNPTSFF